MSVVRVCATLPLQQEHCCSLVYSRALVFCNIHSIEEQLSPILQSSAVSLSMNFSISGRKIIKFLVCTVWVTDFEPTHYHTWELGPVLRNLDPVLGNLDLNRSLVWDLYSGTWIGTWEPVLGSPYSFMYSKIGSILVTHTVPQSDKEGVKSISTLSM